MILDDAHHDTPPTWGFSPNDQVGERGLRDGPAMEAMAHFDEKSMARLGPWEKLTSTWKSRPVSGNLQFWWDFSTSG